MNLKFRKVKLYDRLKKGNQIKKIKIFVKPLLFDENKRWRVEFILKLLQPYFENLYNYIHLNEN